jgi:hypothetical protein
MVWATRKGKDYELESVTRFVMLILANYADKEGNDIYPSLGTLESDTGLSERTIRRHIKTLIGVGLLEYGDQSVVARHPKIRPDQRPKCYRFIFDRDTRGDIDYGRGLNKVPSANPAKRTRRFNDRTQSPPVTPVDNSPENTERPDFDDITTGQTTGLSVHQTENPPINPLPHAAAPVPEDVDHAAVRALREASRARLAAKGFTITEPFQGETK